MDALPSVTFVAPVFNESQSIGEFHRRLTGVMDDLAAAVRCDVIYIDDGSRDGSAAMLAQIAANDPRVSVLFMSRNFGHQLAITAGLDHAGGDAVITIDSDLQDPPEVTTQFIDAWRGGAKIVLGVRRERKGESNFKLATAKIFYWLLNKLSDVPLRTDSGDFRLVDRQVIDVLKEMREVDRYLRGIIGWLGFTPAEVVYDRDARYAGMTKYPLRRMVRLALDGISSFSDRPLRIASHLGLIIVGAATVGVIWVIVGKLFYPATVNQGWASLMIVILFLGGVQLLSVGLLGEYIGRIFRQAKQRPLYVIGRRINPVQMRTGDR